MADPVPQDAVDTEFVGLCNPGFETATHDTVIAENDIIARTGRDGLIASSADDHVVPCAGIDHRITGAKISNWGQSIVAQVDARDHPGHHAILAADPTIVPKDDIVARAARDGCIAVRAAQDDVMAGARRDSILTGVGGSQAHDLSACDHGSVVAKDHVVPVAALNRVIADAADYGVIAVIALY